MRLTMTDPKGHTLVDKVLDADTLGRVFAFIDQETPFVAEYRQRYSDASDKEISAVTEFEKLLTPMSQPERIEILNKIRSSLALKRRDLHAEIATARQKEAALEIEAGALQSLRVWMEGAPSRLEAPRGSAWHKFLAAHQGGFVKWVSGLTAFSLSLIHASPQVFVIEHDWASAFKGATDFDEGEVQLPYDVCCFEFRVSGRRILVLQQNGAPDQAITVFEADGLWFGFPRQSVGAGAADDGDPLGPLNDLLYGNIRAICVAPDAEVAESDVIRSPHKLNKARERRGKLPLIDYRVVSLAHRHRTLVVQVDEPGEGKRKRLHFRRGHWRHYETHKTWIKWTLVGNPDLGFIDKHYKL